MAMIRAKKGDVCFVGRDQRNWRITRVVKTDRDGYVKVTELGRVEPGQQVMMLGAKYDGGPVRKAVDAALAKDLTFETLDDARRALSQQEGVIYEARKYETIAHYSFDDEDDEPVRSNPGRLTLSAARDEARRLGFSLKSRDGEYVLTPSREREGDSSYYTNDLTDALNTARQMVDARWADTRRRGMGGGYEP